MANGNGNGNHDDVMDFVREAHEQDDGNHTTATVNFPLPFILALASFVNGHRIMQGRIIMHLTRLVTLGHVFVGGWLLVNSVGFATAIVGSVLLAWGTFGITIIVTRDVLTHARTGIDGFKKRFGTGVPKDEEDGKA